MRRVSNIFAYRTDFLYAHVDISWPFTTYGNVCIFTVSHVKRNFCINMRMQKETTKKRRFSTTNRSHLAANFNRSVFGLQDCVTTLFGLSLDYARDQAKSLFSKAVCTSA